jgi:hypothetical protein
VSERDIEIGKNTGALQTFMEDQRDRAGRIEAKLDALDERLRGLEKGAAVSGALGGTLSGALVSLATGLALFWLTRGR